MDQAVTIGGLVWFIIGAALMLGIGAVGVWAVLQYAKGMSR